MPTATTTDLVRQCAWCGRTWNGTQWVSEPVQVVGQVTHGMCPECVQKFAIDTPDLSCYGRK